MSAKRVLFYVQHLLGIGHLKRAATLARAFAAQRLEVTLVSGGPAVPGLKPEGVNFVQLPAASAADLGFKVLVDENGRAVDEAWKRRRREALLDAWRSASPHVLVLELFPFGRRQMRFELVPLIEGAARAPRRPAIVSSVRDVLCPGRIHPEREAEALELLERYFDRVLVHGDPAFIAFARSFAQAERLDGRLHYTGYVAERAAVPGAPGGAGSGEVLVSAGGGAVGARLLETAIRARALTGLAKRTWRVLAGANLDAARFAALAALARQTGAGRVIVERSRQDFTALLSNCLLSVSQAGYNTLVEIVQARARAVAVPFSGGNETEQALRGALAAERGLLEVLAEDALAPETLAAAVERAARRPRPLPTAIDLGGAEHSAALVAQWAAERPW